jgi:hypothetical protein
MLEIHVVDLFPVLQVNSFWVEQVMVRKRNKEELFLEGKERAI